LRFVHDGVSATFLTKLSGPVLLHPLPGALNPAVIELVDQIALLAVAALLHHVAEITLLAETTDETATMIDETELGAGALMIAIESETENATVTETSKTPVIAMTIVKLLLMATTVNVSQPPSTQITPIKYLLAPVDSPPTAHDELDTAE
jgi:hypothetical protein